MLVLILLVLLPSLLAVEEEYIRLDNELPYYYKRLKGGRNYEISIFARHDEYYICYLMEEKDWESWYDDRDSTPPTEVHVEVNQTDNDEMFNHKSYGARFIVFWRGEPSKNDEVKFELHIYSAIALEYYWLEITCIAAGILCCCCCCCCVVCFIALFLVYMRCCESSIRGCLWNQCKFLHSKTAAARRANALRRRLDRIKANQRLLPEQDDITHELVEVEPQIEVVTEKRERKFEKTSSEEESSSSSEDEGVKVALIQEKTKPAPKPKPAPAPAPVQTGPQNIQIQLALPSMPGPQAMMMPGQPMLMGHRPVMVGPDGKPMQMGGMIPAGQPMSPMMMSPMMSPFGMAPNQQMFMQGQQQHPQNVSQVGQPVVQHIQQQVPVPVSPTVTQIKKTEKKEPSSPTSSELDMSGDLDDYDVDLEELEDAYKKKKFGASSDDGNSDVSSSGSD